MISTQFTEQYVKRDCVRTFGFQFAHRSTVHVARPKEAITIAKRVVQDGGDAPFVNNDCAKVRRSGSGPLRGQANAPIVENPFEPAEEIPFIARPIVLPGAARFFRGRSRSTQVRQGLQNANQSNYSRKNKEWNELTLALQPREYNKKPRATQGCSGPKNNRRASFSLR